MLKNKKHSLSGRSLILNIVFIALNLLGLYFLVLGYHPSFEANGLLYKILGYGLIISTLVIIFILKGWLLYAYISRVLVGGLFIVSGLIKANDPLGFAYKLEEYFEDGALAYRIKEWFNWQTFSLEFLINQALLISVLICVFEIVLGIMLLLGAKLRSTSWLMLLMMLFFTFLTWHTKECDPNATFVDVDTYSMTSPLAEAKIAEAEFDDNVKILNQTNDKVTIEEVKGTQCVSDCGCFGDAMKGSIGRSLTPAESFWKDIVLLYLVVIIFISRRRIALNDSRENIIFMVSGLIVVAFLSFIFSWSFPIFFTLTGLLLALWIKRIGGRVLGNDWGMILIQTILCFLLVIYVLMYLPIKDYRPYRVGSDLKAEMTNGVPGVYENLMVYSNTKTGQDTLLTALDESTKAIWGDPDNWKFSKSETRTIVPAILPSIQQFDPSIDVNALTPIEYEFEPIAAILKENETLFIMLKDTASNDSIVPLEEFDLKAMDTSRYRISDTLTVYESLTYISLKDYILDQDQILILFSRNLDKGNFSRISRLKEITEKAKEHNIPFILITSSSEEEIRVFREETEWSIPTLQNDETEMKAISRSNPTLMLIEKGVVKGKYPFRSTPSWKWLTENILKVK